MKHLICALALFAIAAPSAGEAQQESNSSATDAVTVQQSVAEDPGHAPIPLVIWSPASGTNLPMILMSHGTGAGPLSHVDTARALASAGFVVVAPMHPGDNFQDDSIVGKSVWFVDRSRQVHQTISYMLEKWPDHSRIKPKAIGIFGFSAGATTALVSIGGKPDLAQAADHCAKSPEFVCKILAPRAADQAPQFIHDDRIAAAVIAAPGLGFAFEPNGLKQVRVPVQLWTGEADQTVPYESNTAIVRRLLTSDIDFHNVPNGSHLSFLAPCSAETPRFLCQDEPNFDRAAFHLGSGLID
ncbi:dienelactone hydrolase family protein [Novosphingobium sp.]|uniref:alpha/beta hydrolase family protein n=1 Tax=Novosphingobium sp. TaxID=1874826 RepID=UPI0026386E25|nr:dienelactone hydrolase family protein [Novosphingobium sp.]